MSIDKKVIALFMAPFICILLALFVATKIGFTTSVTPFERELQKFAYQKIALAQRQPVHAAGVPSPIKLMQVTSKKGFPGVPLSEVAPPAPPEEKKISLILINKTRKMAIINGFVVNEGDSTAFGKIARIEKNKVLLKDKKGEKWVNIRIEQ